MYLKNSKSRKANWRVRNWVMLAIIYVITGFLWLREKGTLDILRLEQPAAPTVVVEDVRAEEAMAIVERGDLYFDQGNLVAAQESYQEAVATDPELGIAYARWGHILTLRHKYDEALIRTEQAVTLAPESAEALAYHAMALEWSGNIEAAISFAHQAIEADPAYAPGYAFLAEAYVDSGRYEEALETAQRAVEIDPDNVWAWRDLGWVYENGARYEEAMAAYQEAIKTQPLSYLYVWLGKRQLFQQEYEAALGSFREATVVDPRNPEGYAELAWTYYLLQDYASATTYAEQGIEKDPTYGRSYAILGLIRYQQLNFEGAIEVLEQAVSYGYATEDVFYELGLSHAYLDQCDQALPWLQRALDLNPESGPAKSGMEICQSS